MSKILRSFFKVICFVDNLSCIQDVKTLKIERPVWISPISSLRSIFSKSFPITITGVKFFYIPVKNKLETLFEFLIHSGSYGPVVVFVNSASTALKIVDLFRYQNMLITAMVLFSLLSLKKFFSQLFFIITILQQVSL